MKKIFVYILAIATTLFAVDVETILENQKKSDFPEIAEIVSITKLEMSGISTQEVTSNILKKGDDKTVTIVKSPVMQLKIIENNGKTKIVDLNTNLSLPAQGNTSSSESGVDISSQLGSVDDYYSASKVGEYWILKPKDPAKTTLYYSEAIQRVVKMTIAMEEPQSSTEYILNYCEVDCIEEKSLEKIEMTTTVSQPEVTSIKIITEFISIKKLNDIPDEIFQIN